LVTPYFRVLAFSLVAGLFGSSFGVYYCIEGYTYSVAAQHEATSVGRVVGIYTGRGGFSYHYEFSVNGVKMDDQSKVCATPLEPGACDNNGPVLVYYSYQPYSNSILEDFAVASKDAYRWGKPALAISLTLLVLSSTGMVIRGRKKKGDRDSDSDSDSEDEKGRSKSDDVPDGIHIVPDE
jgi:hypothetical protein